MIGQASLHIPVFGHCQVYLSGLRVQLDGNSYNLRFWFRDRDAGDRVEDGKGSAIGSVVIPNTISDVGGTGD